MLFRILVVATVLASLGLLCAGRISHASRQLPLICVQSDAFLGRIAVGQLVHHHFCLQNRGATTMALTKVTADCGCIMTHLDRRQLEPGECATLDVTLNTGSLMTPLELVRRIAVSGICDGNVGILSLSIHATVVTELSASVDSQDWTATDESDVYQFTLRVVPTLLNQEEIDTIQFTTNEKWKSERTVGTDGSLVFTVSAHLAQIPQHPLPLEIAYTLQGNVKTCLVPFNLPTPEPAVSIEPGIYTVNIPHQVDGNNATALRKQSVASIAIESLDKSPLTIESISLEGIDGVSLAWESVPGMVTTCQIWLRSLPKGVGPFAGNLLVAYRSADGKCRLARSCAIVTLKSNQ